MNITAHVVIRNGKCAHLLIFIGTYHVISQQYVRKKTYVQLKKMSIFYFCFIEDEATQIHFSRLRSTEYILDVTSEFARNKKDFSLVFQRTVWFFPFRQTDNNQYNDLMFFQVCPANSCWSLSSNIYEIENYNSVKWDKSSWIRHIHCTSMIFMRILRNICKFY